MNNHCNLLKTIISGDKKLKVLLVGIGGVSMYPIAMHLKRLKHIVRGVDAQKSESTKKLEDSGVEVKYKHSKQNVSNCDVVIYSYAVENCLEVKEAKRLNIACFSRAQVLGEILKGYKTSICVAGAHGKSTTTSLIYNILKKSKKNVDLHLGGVLVGDKECNKLTIGLNKNYIVCEACEYKDAFLNLKPTLAVVTNIAEEHLDYFKTFENVKLSFNKFSKSANMLVCPTMHKLDNKNKITFDVFDEVTINTNKKVNNLNFCAKNLIMKSDGTYTFDCMKNDKMIGNFHINLIGKHNVKNALAAICCCDYLKISKNKIREGLSEFNGLERRFEILNKDKFIVHDYAHHPDEINAVISETLKFYKNRLVIVFQPHTYSRTKNLMSDFVDCFKNLKEVVIYKTYSAREKYLKSGSAKILAQNIGENAIYFKSKPKVIEYLCKKVEMGYGVLLLGAGDIYEIAKNVNKLC